MVYSCRDVDGHLDAYVSRTLGGRAALSTRAHLDACPDCRERHDRAVAVLRAVRIGATVVPPPGYIESLPTQVRQRVRSAKTAAVVARRSRWVYAGSAAAVLALIIGARLLTRLPGVNALADGRQTGSVPLALTSPDEDRARVRSLVYRSPQVMNPDQALGRRNTTLITVRLLESHKESHDDSQQTEVDGYVTADLDLRTDVADSSGLETASWRIEEDKWMAWARPSAGGRTASSWARDALDLRLQMDRLLPMRRQAALEYERVGVYGLAFALSGGSSIADVRLPLGSDIHGR